MLGIEPDIGASAYGDGPAADAAGRGNEVRVQQRAANLVPRGSPAVAPDLYGDGTKFTMDRDRQAAECVGENDLAMTSGVLPR